MAVPPIAGHGSGSGAGHGFQYLSSPFGDTTYTKVFVGGLAWETQSEALRRHFEQYGGILEAVVITDKNTGRSKGYGFVTFRDHESARRACVDPSPVIDGRRANCNLASLGRPRPPPLYGRLRTNPSNFGSLQGGPRGAYVGTHTYPQPVPYGYQQGFVYPSYGYQPLGPEYVYSQGVYNPYVGQQYLQMYGVPGAVNPMFPVGQLAQPLPSGHNYPGFQGYALPNHQIVQLSGPNINSVTATPPLTIQAPYPAGMASAAVPAQPQFIVHAQSLQFTQGSSSDQTAG